MDSSSPDYYFARIAADKAKLCVIDSSIRNPGPRVAIVIAEGAELVGWYAKGIGGQARTHCGLIDFVAPPAHHAEQALLEKLADRNLAEASAYITLEPCTEKRAGGLCCADLLMNAGIQKVFVGNCDPNPMIGALAWRKFHDRGIVVRDFPPEIRSELLRDNDAFFQKFRVSTQDSGGAQFDYLSNGGARVLGLPNCAFETRWTERGNGTIYAVDHVNHVALAKHCDQFQQVDDPGRWFEDSHYTTAVAEGQIVVFRNEFGFALVKVEQVVTRSNSQNALLKFRYEIRSRMP